MWLCKTSYTHRHASRFYVWVREKREDKVLSKEKYFKQIKGERVPISITLQFEIKKFPHSSDQNLINFKVRTPFHFGR